MSVATARDIIRDVINVRSLAKNLNAMNPHREPLLTALTKAYDAAFDALAAEDALRRAFHQPPEEQRA